MYSAVICSRRSFFSISCFGTDGTHTDLSLVCLLRSLALGSVGWLRRGVVAVSTRFVLGVCASVCSCVC